MSRNTSRFETAVETVQNSSGLSEGAAEAYVARELEKLGRKEAARYLDVEPSTLDTQHQRAKTKGVRLPEVSKIETAARVGADEDPAVVIWFANDAKLQYRWDGDEIVEETAAADDPHTVVQSFGVGGEREELSAYALESLGEYLNEYRGDIDACRSDWPHIFEALTCCQA
jgi:hypothetical protein